MEKLALHGGEPACSTKIDPTSHRPLRFGAGEKEALLRTIHYLKGKYETQKN